MSWLFLLLDFARAIFLVSRDPRVVVLVVVVVCTTCDVWSIILSLEPAWCAILADEVLGD